VDISANIVVVGGGIAGMVAAVRAAESGLRAIVLERNTEERYLCATRISGGVFHCCIKNVMSPPEELEAAILAQAGDAARPDLAKGIAGDAAKGVRWLQDKGIRFMRGSPDPWHNFVLAPPNLARYGLDWKGRGGDVLLRSLETLLLKAGSEIRRGHEVTGLLMEGDACIGVKGTNNKGAFVARAQNILIADGGFQSNEELVGRYISLRPQSLLQRNARTGLGFGVKMALEAGAGLSRMDAFYGHVQAKAALTNSQLWPYPWWDDVATQGIIVCADGQRFCDEGHGGPFIANSIARLADPLSAYVVWDEDIWNTGGKSRYFPANPNLLTGGAEIHSGKSIEEVARLAGIDAAGLVDQVNRYNASLSGSSLTPPRSSHKVAPKPIIKAPFYCAPVCAGITYTMGGISIDRESRVLRPDGDPIEGLYAAGAATGGIEGGDRVCYVGGLVKSTVTALWSAESMIRHAQA
jgi:fumarate reductase flavoprotein subunit